MYVYLSGFFFISFGQYFVTIFRIYYIKYEYLKCLFPTFISSPQRLKKINKCIWHIFNMCTNVTPFFSFIFNFNIFNPFQFYTIYNLTLHAQFNAHFQTYISFHQIQKCSALWMLSKAFFPADVILCICIFFLVRFCCCYLLVFDHVFSSLISLNF